MADDTVTVTVVFAEDMADTGKTRQVTAEEARIGVRDGRLAYATEAQERKADKVLAQPA